jgi:hypothetical protein
MTRMEEALTGTARGFKRAGIFVCGLFGSFVLLFALEREWAATGFVLIFFIGIFWVMRRAVTRNSPERMRPVLEAVRDAPETIKLLRHYQTSDSRKVFVSDWVSIATEKDQFLIKATKDWQRLVAILKARCPNAKFVDK